MSKKLEELEKKIKELEEIIQIVTEVLVNNNTLCESCTDKYIPYGCHNCKLKRKNEVK